MKIEDEIKGRFRNDYHKGLVNLNFTIKQLSYDFLQSLRKHGLTEPQYNILKILYEYKTETPLSIGFLKERLLDKNSDVSRIVDKLFEKGYIDRTENAVDRRQKDVVINEKGLALLSDSDDCELKADALLKNLTLDEVRELNRLLDKIRD
ncbi:MAG: MarR family transcriptional regulator [Paludibacter sp.]|nr:MarR family transcriptional regulator [Paludibacter sp.]